MAEKVKMANESNQFQSVQVTSIDNSSQTELEAGTECEPLVIGGRKEEVEDDPYHDAYRNGNFGIRRGRINFTRAKRWNVAHFFSALIMTTFTLPCVVIMDDYWYPGVNNGLRDWFTAVTVLCCGIGLAMSSCSFYLLHSLSKIRRPLFFLLLVRLLAVLELLFLVAGISLTIAVASEAQKGYPAWGQRYYIIADNVKSFIVICSFLEISMVVEMIVTASWLFHWWKCFDGCDLLKSFCIFEPGEPLAPGVPDPPTGIIHECAYVCWSIFKIDWNFII